MRKFNQETQLTIDKKNQLLTSIINSIKEYSRKNELKNRPIDQRILFEMDYQKVKPILDIILPHIKENRWQYKLPKKEEYIILSDKPLNVEELEKHNDTQYFRYHKDVFENQSKELKQFQDWHSELNNFLQKWGKATKYTRIYKDYSSILEGESPDTVRWINITSYRTKIEIPIISYHSIDRDEVEKLLE